MTRRWTAIRCAGLSLLMVAVACGGGGEGPTDPQPRELTVEIDGRLERSLEVTLTARGPDGALSPSEVRWSAEPSSHVEFIGADRARLEETGAVTIRAEADGLSGERSVTVEPPPAIVFERRDPGGNLDVWRAALDGRDVQRLTDAPVDDGDPTAAGGQVVFVSSRSGNGDLYAVPAGGGDATRLTAEPTQEVDPALSRDGARLAFARPDERGLFAVWTAESDGTVAERVTDELGFDFAIETSPSWSPDGDRLAVMSTARGAADVWQVTVSSGEAMVLAGRDESEVQPAWHPDAERVAFAAVVDDDTELFLLDLEDDSVTRLTERSGTDAQPAWLPDGRLVYTARSGGMPELRWLDPADPAAVHVIPLDGAPEHPHGIFE